MNIGDTIKCSDKDNLINTMTGLAKDGIQTDFDYSKKDEYRLVVIQIDDMTEQMQGVEVPDIPITPLKHEEIYKV